VIFAGKGAKTKSSYYLEQVLRSFMKERSKRIHNKIDLDLTARNFTCPQGENPLKVVKKSILVAFYLSHCSGGLSKYRKKIDIEKYKISKKKI
jgi:hypothetical protein